ncbi:Rieske-like 2Fe-2S protein [Asanoa ferruginea]|uniref:Rieske-like 2Fe-2S protein n=1 Tax=Asanoa ferruginea TaxID=53367 RepID=A0A3D9ZP94_9ACTN|nr:Rieske 2Fe-2S domain-containing protein [Asanoa ferruginea]REF99188.1 Rieske-like 2Fe-2S protein [Asanoa ferruginea]GIF45779.1 phenoxybenzoate dioxygenase [Asanoa ferruginea]
MVYSVPVTSVGPGTPAGQVLRQSWHPIGVSADLEPGKARPLRILGEEFTLYRGRSGKPYIVGSRCAHRYTWLHTGWVEEDNIRCFYHGWKYDGGGQCIEMPAENEAFAKKIKIPHYRAVDYAGLIFGYFGDEDVPPPMWSFPQFDDPGNHLVSSIRPPGVWPMNYFQALENGVDPVHTAFVHSKSEPHWNGVPEVDGIETDEGLEITATRVNHDGVKDVRVTHYFFPNLSRITIYLVSGEDHQFNHYIWFVPIDDENTLMISNTVIPKHLVEQVPGFIKGAGRGWSENSHHELMNAERGPESVTEEDYTAMVGQGRVADRTNERLGRSDRVVIKLRHIWTRKIESLEPRGAGVPDLRSGQARPLTGRNEVPHND